MYDSVPERYIVNSLKRDFDDFRDSAALKSDALASEISFQIDDLKLLPHRSK